MFRNHFKTLGGLRITLSQTPFSVSPLDLQLSSNFVGVGCTTTLVGV